MKRVLKVLLLVVVVLALLVTSAIAVLFARAPKPARPVGFTSIVVPDAGDKPLEVGIWYPTDVTPGFRLIGLSAQRVAGDAAVVGRHLPLIVISHGSGGLLASHSDTALALAAAGFVVAAVTHTGDNARDDSYMGTPRWLVDRARHVQRVLDYLLARWPAHDQLDSARVGLFGFSAGAFTALVTAGGVPDLARITSHCKTTPEFACTLWKQLPQAVPAAAWVHDRRVKALVVAAPGYGFAFEPAGLSDVTSPVQLWSGRDDRNVPYDTNTAVVRRLLPKVPEEHAVAGAGHFAFLAPCPAWLLPTVCKDAGDFDRAAFHREFNDSVVRFFHEQLASH